MRNGQTLQTEQAVLNDGERGFAWAAARARRVLSALRGSRLVSLVCITLCMSTLMTGCGMFSAKGEKVRWDNVTLAADDDVNNNSPVAVDVVFVTDDAMLARIAELPAAKWFANRADLVNTFPKSIQYKSWELVPGQRIEVKGDSFGRPRVEAAFLFANYTEPGAHRVRLDKLTGNLAVQLNTYTFTVLAVK